MICLDTNIVVRYIAQDDVVQSAKATQLIESLSAETPWLYYVSKYCRAGLDNAGLL